MKKLLLIAVPVLLSGCSVYNQLVERMQTDTLEYRCDEKPLTVKLNNPRQEASFVYDNKLLTLKRGSPPPARATATVFTSSGRKVTAPPYTNATASC